MILTSQQIAKGQRFPRGYGFAWYDFILDVRLAYPIPFNWILRWIRDLYFLLAKGPSDIHEQNIYRAGYHEGCSQIAQAKEAGRKQALTEIFHRVENPVLRNYILEIFNDNPSTQDSRTAAERKGDSSK